MSSKNGSMLVTVTPPFTSPPETETTICVSSTYVMMMWALPGSGSPQYRLAGKTLPAGKQGT